MCCSLSRPNIVRCQKSMLNLSVIKKIILPSILAMFFIAIFSIHSLNKHSSFSTNALDLGIHTQAIYLFSNSFSPYSSILHMPYLADHFGLITFFLSFLYRFFPEASTLLILQAILIGISSIFIYLIALDKLKNIFISFLITLCYLASPSIISAVDFDFHLATISVFPLALILYSWYFKKNKLYWISLLIGIAFKEDIQIFIFGLGIYQLIQKQYKQGLATVIFAVISFYIIKFIFMPSLWVGAENLDIGTSILPFNDPITLIYLLFTKPTVFSDQIFNSQIKLDTIDFVYRQFGFLSLLSPLSWLTIFPALFLRFSSLATHFWISNFHYNANLVPFMAVSAILALGKFKIPLTVTTTLLVFFLITGGLAPNKMIWITIQNPFQDFSRFEYLKNSLKNIPSTAKISAQSPIVPHLANREKIYMFPDLSDANYIILDTKVDSYPLENEELNKKIQELENSPLWQVEKKKTLLIFRKTLNNQLP